MVGVGGNNARQSSPGEGGPALEEEKRDRSGTRRALPPPEVPNPQFEDCIGNEGTGLLLIMNERHVDVWI